MTVQSAIQGKAPQPLPRWPRSVMGLALLLGGMTQALGQGQTAGSGPSMDRLNMGNPDPAHALVPTPAAAPKKEPFFDDTKLGAQARSFYFNRDKYDPSRSEAWAIGGSVSYRSGYIADLFRIGGVVYTSQPLYAPDEHDGTLLLKPGQAGYTVIGQAYGEFKITNQIFAALGRKEYDTPYVNRHDVRMTPNTFEGATLYGRAGGKGGDPQWRFGGGYLTQIKEKNSDEFKWMSSVAGAPAGVDRGVALAGFNFEQKGLSIGAIDYYSDDIINIFYTEGGLALAPAEGYKLKLAAQYSDQQSTGDDLLTGQPFSTSQWGLKGDLSVAQAIFTLAYTKTGTGADMRSPWGGHPGYTSSQVKDFFRANESAVLLKAAYDFSRHGAAGLTGYALWVHGSGVAAPRFNEDEYDFNLQWAPSKTGDLRGLSFRLRYARINQNGGGDPAINDFRFIVNYDFPRP